jgi:Zn-dependent protease with chaperone function
VNDREHWLFLTHPPIERRLEQLERLERTLQGTAER